MSIIASEYHYDILIDVTYKYHKETVGTKLQYLMGLISYACKSEGFDMDTTFISSDITYSKSRQGYVAKLRVVCGGRGGFEEIDWTIYHQLFSEYLRLHQEFYSDPEDKEYIKVIYREDCLARSEDETPVLSPEVAGSWLTYAFKPLHELIEETGKFPQELLLIYKKRMDEGWEPKTCAEVLEYMWDQYWSDPDPQDYNMVVEKKFGAQRAKDLQNLDFLQAVQEHTVGSAAEILQKELTNELKS